MARLTPAGVCSGADRKRPWRAGWLNVQSFADPPEGLLNYPCGACAGPMAVSSSCVCARRRGWPEPTGKLEGITDRTTPSCCGLSD